MASNRRAKFDYEIVDTYEAGMVLLGSEVKSLREGKASINEAYASERGGELWLESMNIPPYTYSQISRDTNTRKDKKINGNRSYKVITLDDLRDEDAELTDRIIDLAADYGYEVN